MIDNARNMRSGNLLGWTLLTCMMLAGCDHPGETAKPNILFCISDDQTWIHTSIMGTKEINTPGFDRIAREGILFENAYTAAPSCAPSRAAILTGQEIYRLKEGGLLFGALSEEFQLFPKMLETAGYHIGYTAKDYSPANKTLQGYWQNPLGEAFNAATIKNPPEGIYGIDYAENFRQFLDGNRSLGKPFFFWYGCVEPHREYGSGIGRANGKDPRNIKVPGFLPDSMVVQEDMADYFFEIEWFDRHLQRMIKLLDEQGELDNTIIVVTSDNGMPFPRAKANLYEYGTHMPLAIRWGDHIKGGRKVKDFVSFTDFAPTFLEAAGLDIPAEMTGNSLMEILLSDRSGFIEADRNRVVTAIERHTYCRPGGFPYPSRAIRKDNWVYIRNFEPERWPAGHPHFYSPHQGFYGDIDAGPTRSYILENKDDPDLSFYYRLACEKRSGEELYDLDTDPYELNNLAGNPSYGNELKELREELFAYLEETNDPRMMEASPWDDYPYYFQAYEKRAELPVEKRDTIINGVIR
jgi:N-sulfoglucosamine sulfohydrolase